MHFSYKAKQSSSMQLWPPVCTCRGEHATFSGLLQLGWDLGTLENSETCTVLFLINICRSLHALSLSISTCSWCSHSGHWLGQGVADPVPSLAWSSSLRSPWRPCHGISFRIAQLVQRRNSWLHTDSCTVTATFCSSCRHPRHCRCKDFFSNMPVLLDSAIGRRIHWVVNNFRPGRQLKVRTRSTTSLGDSVSLTEGLKCANYEHMYTGNVTKREKVWPFIHAIISKIFPVCVHHLTSPLYWLAIFNRENNWLFGGFLNYVLTWFNISIEPRNIQGQGKYGAGYRR